MAPIVENLLEAADSLDSSARVFKPRAPSQTGVNEIVNGIGGGNGGISRGTKAGGVSASASAATAAASVAVPQHKKLHNAELVDALLESDGGCGASLGEVFDDEDGPVGTRSLCVRVANKQYLMYCIVFYSKHDKCLSVCKL